MRIAVSGAHRTGKTTLVSDLVASLPTFSAVDEPYYLLENEEHSFAEIPGFDDFELQLDHGRLRQRVHEELLDIVLYDQWAFGVPAIEVSGAPHERASQVLAYLRDNDAVFPKP